MRRAEFRCKYCHLHQNNSFASHEIDHIYAEKHGGATTEVNLCVACSGCNRHKGSDICSIDPLTGEIVPLYHPRQDKWEDHFRFGEDGFIEALTPTGRVTARIVNFNELARLERRARLMRANLY
jgi:5-methylcytosine-specific restriction endonuclease McrA